MKLHANEAWDDRAPVAVIVHAMVAGRRAGRADDGPPVPGAHVVLSVAVAGALVGLVILLVDLPAWDDTQRKLARTGPFTLWAAAIALQTMAWVLALPVIRRIARRWRTDAAVRSREVKIGTAALLLVGSAIALGPPLLGRLPETIPHRGLKTAILNALAFALATYGARAMWYVVAQLRTVAAADVVDVGVLERHQRLHRDLEVLLAILGTLVSLAVIASAALRAVTVEADPQTALPPQAVITYGVTLSVTLALLYVPAFMTVLSAGHALRERVAPLLGADDPGFVERLDLRDRLRTLLGLDVSATVSFRAAAAILAPLLGSLTSLLPELG
jgi:hypothetical protein